MGNCCSLCLNISVFKKSPRHYGFVSKKNSSEPRVVTPLNNEIEHPIRKFVDIPLDD